MVTSRLMGPDHLDYIFRTLLLVQRTAIEPIHMSTSIKEIESLIYLLEDPDPSVQNSVKRRFRELGEQAVPILDQVRTRSNDQEERHVISEVLHGLTFENLYEEFALLMERRINDRLRLEEAVFQLSRIGNPTLHIPEYRRRLDRFASELSGEICYEYSGEKKMRVLLHYIFSELRFRGDLKQYHSCDNALVDRVIDRRRGLPISLSMIVLFLARRLDLPFYGVNMPIHFMVIYESAEQKVLIDPFDGGTLVTVDQCHYFLKKNGIAPRPDHLQRCHEQQILIRFIRNLIHSYSAAGHAEKVVSLNRLLELAELES